MKSKLKVTTQSRLKAVCDEILHQHNLSAADLQAEVQIVMNQLGGEHQAAEQILDMIHERMNQMEHTVTDSEKLKKFLEKLERDETRH
jgi:hypothetical protein